MKHVETNPTLRFTAPLIVENLLTILTVQIAAVLIGRISGASLAATGTGNIMITFTTSAFAMINTGSAVLVSRLVGERKGRDAAEVLEQAIGLLTMTSAAAAALFFTAARPILRLLMPNGEAALMNEAVIYFRISALSFPFLMLETLLSSTLRAAGNSRASMVLGVGMNATMALLAALLIGVFGLGIYGAGWAYAGARIMSAGASLIIVARYHGRFIVNLRNVFRPRREVYRHIIRVGLPISLESLSVQGGYLIANSLAVGLGTLSATVYQVCTNINTLNWIPASICTAAVQPLVGLRLGAGQTNEAKKAARQIWLTAAVSVTAISAITAVFGRTVAGFYSSDASVIDMARSVLWLCLVMGIPAISVNTTDGTLRAGGDAKYVMTISVISIWLIRLPLSWLLAYHFNLGVIGLFLANEINLLFRTTAGLLRFSSGKWIHQNL